MEKFVDPLIYTNTYIQVYIIQKCTTVRITNLRFQFVKGALLLLDAFSDFEREEAG